MGRHFKLAATMGALLILVLCSTARACIKDTDCGESQYCCKAHCTSLKIRCSRICLRDEDCSRDYLCTQSVCLACSKRYNCELKSCFNDTHCPTTHSCNNHMCTKKKPPNQTFTILPFIIIIAVLGFALLVLCYTEGCWKELFVYLKRHFGRYGSVARDEHEADQRDLGENESETGSHCHSNKTCVDPQSLANATSSQPSTTNSTSPNTLRNTQVVVTHNNEIRPMTLPESRPSRSRSPSTVMTSSTNPSCLQTSRVPDSLNVGILPSLCDPHTITRNPSPLPPTYNSLFNDENEEPPPNYEEVVNNMTRFSPICIEMSSIAGQTSLSLNHPQETETTV